MAKTIEQINNDIKALITEREQIEETSVNDVVSQLVDGLTKKQIKQKIKDLMKASPMLKFEMKRLLIDNVQEDQ